jgi:hypothetical protein
MKRLIEKITDTDVNKIKEYNKNIGDVINYLKSIELPKKPKKEEKMEIEEKIADIIKIEDVKEYNNNEKKWINIFDKLGGEKNE